MSCRHEGCPVDPSGNGHGVDHSPTFDARSGGGLADTEPGRGCRLPYSVTMQVPTTPSSRSASAPIRVLFIDTAQLGPLGAGPWLHVQLLRRLDRAEHELHVACARGTDDRPAPMYALLQTVEHVRVVGVGFGPDHLRSSLRRSVRSSVSALIESAGAVVGFLRLAIYARRRRIQVIHTDERPRDAAASVLIARISGAKCVIHMHVAYGEWQSPLLKWALRRTDGIIAISQYVSDSLSATHHDRDRIHLVFNGIDPTRWHPGKGRQSARLEFNIAADVPVVLAICRLIEGKGVDDLIRAMPIVLSKHPNARLLVAGSEPVAGYRRSLEDLASELGVEQNVTFCGWRTDVDRLLAASDIFAMPSRGEPFGLAYLEAMAMKRPIVAYRSGATAEVVVHGETGLLTEPGNVAGLAEHIVTLIERPDEREAMGSRGRTRVEREFPSDRMVEDSADVYRRLTQASDHPA